jgi:hypothetical protein
MSTLTMTSHERTMHAAVTVRVECPSCGQPANVPTSALGQRAQCNGCGATFVIPKPGATRRIASPPPPPPVPAMPPAPPIDWATRHVETERARRSLVRRDAVFGLFGGLGLVVLGFILTAAMNGERIFIGAWIVGGLMALRALNRIITGRE